MKKKLTVNSIALGNLKSRKKQYVLMIIGIIFAMVFSSGTLFFLSSLNASEKEMKNKSVGSQSAILIDTDDKGIEIIKDSGLADDIAFAHTIGYAYADKSFADKGTFIAWLDDACKEISYQSVREGKLPETENEIAIERGALLKLGLECKVGDSITLSVLTQNGGATMETPVEKTYKLVGILNDKRSNISYNYSEGDAVPAAFVCKNTLPEPGGKERLDAYIVSESEDRLFDFIYNIIENIETGPNIVETVVVSGSTHIGSLIEKIALAVFFTVVLLAVSCLGIINSFNTNLRERKKQIGMLRAVGATRRQIILIFGREAFIISIISVPLSLAVSYFGVKGIVNLLGDGMVLPFDWRIFVLCGVFSIVSVMLAAMIPLFSASRITPMQSIRNISVMRKVKEKHIRTQKSFKMPELLAKRNIAFYKTRHIIMCVILAITVALSSFGFSAYNYSATYDYDYGYDYQIISHDLYVMQYINYENEKSSGFNESALQRIASIPYAGEAYGVKSCMAVVLVDAFSDYMITFGDESPFDISNFLDAENPKVEDFLKMTRAKFKEDYLEFKRRLGFDKELYRTELASYSADFIKKYIEPYVVEGKIDIDKLNSGEEIILYAPERVGFSCGTTDGGYHYGPVYNDDIEKDREVIATAERDIKAGDTFDISVLSDKKNREGWDDMASDTSDTARNDRTVTVGAIVDNIPSSVFGFGFTFTEPCFNFITTDTAMHLYSENESYNAIYMNLNCECNDEIDSEIEQILNDIRLTVNNSWMQSQYEQNTENKKNMQTFLIAMLAIIVLFFSICASIINNAITASIREGKREIGTLRAVGASLRELFGSYVRQVLTTLSIGCGSGFAVYLVGYAILSLAVKYNRDFEKVMLFSPWETLGACVILFAVCCINLLAKIRKEMKNSIVDNIREL